MSSDCGLVAAGAHPFRIHEDLCMSLSLDKLKEIFHSVVNEYLNRAKSLGWEPVVNPVDMYTHIHAIARHTFPKELYW